MRAPKFLGVYSKKNHAAPRASGNAGGAFHFVWELENASYAVQPLDSAFVPIGPPRLLSAAQLRSRYRPEPSQLAAPLSTPDLRQLQLGARNEAAELNDDTLAELEKARKARQVENDLRDSFNKALRALNRPRDRKGALAALEQLATVSEGIVPAHKHMFRDFGVSLRKKSLPELALQCARRVLELAPNDDHAHFNMARLLAILDLPDEALAHLRIAMSIDSREKAYRRLKAHIEMSHPVKGSSRSA